MDGVEGAFSVQRAFFDALRSGSTFRRSGSAAEPAGAGVVLRETDMPVECAGFWAMRVPS